MRYNVRNKGIVVVKAKGETMLIDNYEEIVQNLDYMNSCVEDIRDENEEVFSCLSSFVAAIKEQAIAECGSMYLYQVPHILNSIWKNADWLSKWNEQYRSVCGELNEDIADTMETIFVWGEFRNIFLSDTYNS